jgi:transposase-like protein
MIDAIVFHVQRDNMVQKTAVYIVLGINSDGMKEVLSIEVGGSESAKYWLSVLNNLKNRGVRDIFVLCSDALSGIKEAVAAAYPMTEHQLCIVHIVRNTLKHVADKDRKGYANALKSIYHAPSEESAREALDNVADTWESMYPNSMKRWYDNWSHICPIFKYSAEVRKAIYTTNPIESLNSQYRRINRSRSVFPTEKALKKAIYLATLNITKKWTNTIRNWGKVYGEFTIMFGDRL